MDQRVDSVPYREVVKVRLILEQVTKPQRGGRSLALLFL